MHCPARTTDSRDVLIRLIAKDDEGLNHLTALRCLGTGLVAFRREITSCLSCARLFLTI